MNLKCTLKKIPRAPRSPVRHRTMIIILWWLPSTPADRSVIHAKDWCSSTRREIQHPLSQIYCILFKDLSRTFRKYKLTFQNTRSEYCTFKYFLCLGQSALLLKSSDMHPYALPAIKSALIQVQPRSNTAEEHMMVVIYNRPWVEPQVFSTALLEIYYFLIEWAVLSFYGKWPCPCILLCPHFAPRDIALRRSFRSWSLNAVFTTVLN
jgi:hypothetical protein